VYHPLCRPGHAHLVQHLQGVEDAKVVQVDTDDPAKTVKIGVGLDPKQEGEFVDFLRCNKDIFVWSPAEMSSVP
jgi:hypothetical protein